MRNLQAGSGPESKPRITSHMSLPFSPRCSFGSRIHEPRDPPHLFDVVSCLAGGQRGNALGSNPGTRFARPAAGVQRPSSELLVRANVDHRALEALPAEKGVAHRPPSGGVDGFTFPLVRAPTGLAGTLCDFLHSISFRRDPRRERPSGSPAASHRSGWCDLCWPGPQPSAVSYRGPHPGLGPGRMPRRPDQHWKDTLPEIDCQAPGPKFLGYP
jgi:hypothetical protein